jgi:hypothetical protein
MVSQYKITSIYAGISGGMSGVLKLLKWLSVKSVDELNTKILNFISYYNRTMAKAFKWNYQPKSQPSTSHS